ncbi:hypothetical protein [Pseudomonas sp. UBA6323]|uniref:hypothetical protein n=1 Tax=Pseudomonas sp. UBA6323 TaxID=1947329 RepID=UPI0026007775|nr:hypothetical protein [Pseudomonas sp. UBA6323]
MSDGQKKQPLAMPDNLAEAQALMERLSADCNHVRAQVGAAKAEQKASSRYADPNWFHRANTALRWMNRDRQRLQDHIALLRREARQAESQSGDQVLIALLRARVGEQTFQELALIARQQQETFQ